MICAITRWLCISSVKAAGSSTNAWSPGWSPRSHSCRALCATATDGRSQGVHPTPWNCTKSHKSHRQSGPTKKNSKVHIGHPRLHQASCLPRKSHQQGGHAGTLRDAEACIRPPPCATKATKTKTAWDQLAKKKRHCVCGWVMWVCLGLFRGEGKVYTNFWGHFDTVWNSEISAKIIMVLSSGFNMLWAKIVKQKIWLNLNNKKI